MKSKITSINIQAWDGAYKLIIFRDNNSFEPSNSFVFSGNKIGRLNRWLNKLFNAYLLQPKSTVLDYNGRTNTSFTIVRPEPKKFPIVSLTREWMELEEYVTKDISDEYMQVLADKISAGLKQDNLFDDIALTILDNEEVERTCCNCNGKGCYICTEDEW